MTGRMRNLEISMGYITRLLDVQEDQKELERQFIYHASQLDRNLLVSINKKVSEPLEIDQILAGYVRLLLRNSFSEDFLKVNNSICVSVPPYASDLAIKRL